VTISSEAVRRLSIGAVRQRKRLEELEHANSQRAVTRCSECNWYWRGTVGEGKQAFQAHRKDRHV
jgi:hypothetical protein